MKFFTTVLGISNFILLSAHLGSAAPTLEGRQLAQVYTQCTVPNTVAITFDDGPYDFILDVAKTFNDAGGKATFFFNGNNWRCIYNFQDQIKSVYNQGHQLASHTWAHKDLATLNWDQLHDEFWRVEQALQRIVGVTPAMMRPPYGSYNDLVRQVAQARGQSVVNWDYDTQDAAATMPSPAERVENYRKLIQEQHPSTILALNHEVKQETVYDVIPQVVQWLKEANYRMVTVAECLGMEPYQKVESPQTPDASWTC
ncbi:carbohydrate esterase family 4 protein [Marasmius fiardii PR-910]|nr:carbohydrate esterase family 4 protein [Marasmius fiardii PR-910]